MSSRFCSGDLWGLGLYEIKVKGLSDGFKDLGRRGCGCRASKFKVDLLAKDSAQEDPISHES